MGSGPISARDHDPTAAADHPLPEGATTADILAACRRGHRGAEETLFRQYFARLIGLARRRMSRRLATRVDPEDVVLSAYRSFFIGLRDGTRFTAAEETKDLWPLLVTITRRKVAKQARRQGAQRRAVSQERSVSAEHAVDPGGAAEAAAILADEVEQLLASLGKTDREVLVRQLQGADAATIAAQLGCSERTVRRARERIDHAIAARNSAEPTLNGPATGTRQLPETRSPAGGVGSPDLVATHRETDLLLQEMIGEGAFTKVFRARNRHTRETIAVKFLKKGLWREPRAVASLLREYEILRPLDHPGLAGIRGWGVTRAGATFLVLQWIEGRTLTTWFQEKHPIAEGVAVALEMAEALLFAHEHGVLHGDLSPSNILRSSEGRIVLTDFGFARWSDRPDEGAARGGTPGYLAPEVLTEQYGPISRRSDIYGFGAVLFALLTGEPPVKGRDFDEILRKTLTGSASPLAWPRSPAVPALLRDLVTSCVALAPENRPTDFGAVIASLRAGATAEDDPG